MMKNKIVVAAGLVLASVFGFASSQKNAGNKINNREVIPNVASTMQEQKLFSCTGDHYSWIGSHAQLIVRAREKSAAEDISLSELKSFKYALQWDIADQVEINEGIPSLRIGYDFVNGERSSAIYIPINAAISAGSSEMQLSFEKIREARRSFTKTSDASQNLKPS